MDVRIPFLVYGLLYVVVELVGARLEEIGWPRLTALDVATAVVHSVFTVCVGVAVLLGLDVVIRHWRRSRAAWHAEQARLAAEAEPETITVQAWRAEPLALPAGTAGRPFNGPDNNNRDYRGLPLYAPYQLLDA
ncbi:hypothetical protein ACI797_08580, partial [Geodermatophilus sp. SYSU D00691]